MPKPTGIPESQIIKELAQIEAFGEIMNTAPPQLAAIVAKARKALEEQP